MSIHILAGSVTEMLQHVPYDGLCYFARRYMKGEVVNIIWLFSSSVLILDNAMVTLWSLKGASSRCEYLGWLLVHFVQHSTFKYQHGH